MLERGVRFIDDQGSEAVHIQQLLSGIKRDEASDTGVKSAPSKHLETENAELKHELAKLKDLLEKEKADKKRILPAYNDILHKLRESCSSLKLKVD